MRTDSPKMWASLLDRITGKDKAGYPPIEGEEAAKAEIARLRARLLEREAACGELLIELSTLQRVLTSSIGVVDGELSVASTCIAELRAAMEAAADQQSSAASAAIQKNAKMRLELKQALAKGSADAEARAKAEAALEEAQARIVELKTAMENKLLDDTDDELGGGGDDAAPRESTGELYASPAYRPASGSQSDRVMGQHAHRGSEVGGVDLTGRGSVRNSTSRSPEPGADAGTSTRQRGPSSDFELEITDAPATFAAPAGVALTPVQSGSIPGGALSSTAGSSTELGRGGKGGCCAVS